MQMQYKLRVPDEIVAFVRGLHPLLKKRVKAALTEISQEPYCGKALKDEFSDLRSYRVKRFRIIYKILSKKQISIVAVGPRKYIYEETFRIISKQKKDKK
jgi:mRNA interferase RelE/StbE